MGVLSQLWKEVLKGKFDSLYVKESRCIRSLLYYSKEHRKGSKIVKKVLGFPASLCIWQ